MTVKFETFFFLTTFKIVNKACAISTQGKYIINITGDLTEVPVKCGSFVALIYRYQKSFQILINY